MSHPENPTRRLIDFADTLDGLHMRLAPLTALAILVVENPQWEAALPMRREIAKALLDFDDQLCDAANKAIGWLEDHKRDKEAAGAA